MPFLSCSSTTHSRFSVLGLAGTSASTSTGLSGSSAVLTQTFMHEGSELIVNLFLLSFGCCPSPFTLGPELDL